VKVLIVDDQYDLKVRTTFKVLNELGVESIKHVVSSFDAIKEMSTENYDLLILDLHIPQRLGDEIDPEGGRSLLKYLELNPKINKPTEVLGVTAQREAYNEAVEFFRDRGWTMLLDSDGSGIRPQLETILRTQISHIGRAGSECDLFIITALAHTELQAVLALNCKWEPLKLQNRPEVFYKGHFTDKHGKSRTLCATSLPTMGMTAAAAVSAYVCAAFKPRYLIMAGIAAGIPGKANLGDILVASPSWDWGSGKLTVRDGKPYFLSAPTQISLDQNIHALLSALSAEKRYLGEIFLGWKGLRPAHELSLRVGPIASGAVVLEDPSTVDLIKAQHRATVGIEMEAFGVMSAAYYAGANGPKAIIIKSVCDFADPEKNDEWQGYAAYTSAEFAFRLITKELDFV